MLLTPFFCTGCGRRFDSVEVQVTVVVEFKTGSAVAALADKAAILEETSVEEVIAVVDVIGEVGRIVIADVVCKAEILVSSMFVITLVD